jgi:hypothetical protein
MDMEMTNLLPSLHLGFSVIMGLAFVVAEKMVLGISKEPALNIAVLFKNSLRVLIGSFF